MITFNNISIGYDTSLLKLDHIDLSTGEVHVLIGKNGTGKTTLLKTITSTIPPIDGSIAIDNTLLSALPPSELSKLVSFVPTVFPKTPYIRVDEFISLGRSPHTNSFGTLRETDKDAVQKAIQILDIDHLKERFTSDLSDGERALVAIASAICQSTPIILLDEPLAFLDYSNRKLVLGKLRHLADHYKKCILFSSHDLDIILDYKFHFLLINPETKEVHLHSSKCTRQEIIDCCFPEN